MPLPKIYALKVGYSNSVLIKNGNQSVLVDTGVHGFMHLFQKYFKRLSVQFSDIRLIILTHVHYDHTGNLKELQKITGAKVAVNQNEYHNLKIGFIPIPFGITPTTRFISAFGRIFVPRFTSPSPYVADLVVDKEYDLFPEYGIEAKVISTPGHTNGSQSVQIGNSLISGDAFINIQPGTVFPHYVNDPAQLMKTWQWLFSLGIQDIYPGHGAKFTIEKALADYEKWGSKYLVYSNRSFSNC